MTNKLERELLEFEDTITIDDIREVLRYAEVLNDDKLRKLLNEDSLHFN